MSRVTQMGVILEIIMYKEGLNQKELAEKLGVCPSSIGNVLSGKSNTCPKVCAMLIKAYPSYVNSEEVARYEFASRRWYKVYGCKIPAEQKDEFMMYVRQFGKEW